MLKKHLNTSNYYYIPLIILSITMLLQGGFFPSRIVISGLLSAVALFLARPKYGKNTILLCVFCIWYLICNLRNGFVTERFSVSLLPVSALIFQLIISDERFDRDKFICRFISVSSYFAIVAIIISFAKSIIDSSFIRLIFPFGYSNTAGLFYGVLFVLSCKYNSRAKYLFVIALLMSFSLGAILIVYAYLFFTSDKKMKFVLLIGGIITAIVFHGKLISSYYTFVERLLMINDGARCIAENPIFGIGAGNWKDLVHQYKTGFYSANQIHCSYVQIAVDSGLVGLALCISMIILSLKKQSTIFKVCMVLILVDSLVEFNSSYLAIWQIYLVLSIVNTDIEVKKWITRAVSIFTALVFVAFVILHINIVLYLQSANTNDVVDRFEGSKINKLSEKCESKYLQWEYQHENKDKVLNIINSKKTLSEEMIYMRFSLVDDKAEMLDKYPFNSYLLHMSNSDTLDNIKEKMSLFGEILYNAKGENSSNFTK